MGTEFADQSGLLILGRAKQFEFGGTRVIGRGMLAN